VSRNPESLDALLRRALAEGRIDRYVIEGDVVTLEVRGYFLALRTDWSTPFVKALIDRDRQPPDAWWKP
jgi:hypothetical protein